MDIVGVTFEELPCGARVRHASRRRALKVALALVDGLDAAQHE